MAFAICGFIWRSVGLLSLAFWPCRSWSHRRWWRRSDAEITAQQKIDQVIAHKKQAELEKLQKERQAEFKRLDDKLKAMGI